LADQENQPTQNQPRGNSRAAQNKKLRRDALREELAARKYLDQISEIDEELQGETWKENLAAMKLRLDIQFKRLAKVLPDLKSTSAPVHIDGMEGSLTQMAEKVVAAMSNGELSPDDGVSLLRAMSSVAKVHEFDALAARVAALEEKHAKKT